MRRYRSAIALMLLALAGLSCSKDPEVAKREYLAEGDRFVAEKKYPEAILQYRNALRQDAKFGEARVKLSDAYGAMGDVANATRELIRAADALPDDSAVQVRAGQALIMAGQFPEARARALAALSREPRNPDALMVLGNALAGLKDLDGAIAQVQEAIDEDPQLVARYANLGLLYVAKGDKDAAETSFKRAVEVAPQSADAHLSLANFKWAAGEREEAENELKIALKLDPKSATANRALATLYLTQNKAAAAEPYLKTYADTTKTVESRLMLADYYAMNGRRPEAVAVLTPLAQEDAGFIPATLRLAVADFSSRARPEAYRKIESVLTKAPNNQEALETKGRFLLAEGRTDEALALAKSIVDANPKSPRGQYLTAGRSPPTARSTPRSRRSRPSCSSRRQRFRRRRSLPNCTCVRATERPRWTSRSRYSRRSLRPVLAISCMPRRS